MKTINTATVMGNIGKEPEVIELDSGKKMARLTVATEDNWKDKEGQWHKKTEWHKVVIFNEGLIKAVVEPKLQKGTTVHITAKLVTTPKQKEGVTHYNTALTITQFDGEIIVIKKSKDDNKTAQEEGSN